MADGEMTFPILKEKEIVSCSVELNVPIAEEDIRRPQSEVISKVYDMYAELFLNLSPDDYRQQPTFGAMMIDNPELHEESLPFLIKNAAMGVMMRACGINDFSIADVMSPEPKRVKKILSALINFAKFREMQMVAIEQLLENREKLVQEQAAAEAELLAAQTKMATIEAQRQAEAPQVANLEKETEEIANSIVELNKIQADLQAKVRSGKDQLTEVNDKVSKITFEVESVRQQCSQYNAQIVRSPERIKKEIVRIGANLTEEQREVAAAETRARTLEDQVAKLTESQSDLRRSRRMLDEVCEEYKRLDRVNGNVADAQDRAAAERKQLKEVTAATELLQRQHDSALNRLAQLEAAHETKRDAGKQSFEEARRERERIASDKDRLQTAVKENTAIVGDIRRRITEAKATHEAEMETLRTQFNSLLAQINSYHSGLESAMNMPIHA